jgi:polysaccharide export outer membrane protein
VRKRLAVLLLVMALSAIGQQRPEPPPVIGSVSSAQGSPSDKVSESKQTLSVNDQLVISATDVPNIGDRPYRVELDGTITVPLVGRMRAQGLTLEQFEKELTSQLALYVRSPRVSVKRLSETAPAAQTIIVAGAFKNPGVYTLAERRSLIDVLSSVGGLQPNAARMIKITRRLDGEHTPLRDGIENSTLRVSTTTVNVSHLMENPAKHQILIEPNDVLHAGPSGIVFLTGEVLKPGSFELLERDSYGLTELILMGGGLKNEAAPDQTKILRPILNGSRRAEIFVDVKSIFAGKQADFAVMPNDMVVVPKNKSKTQALKTAARFVIPALATTLIYVAVR